MPEFKEREDERQRQKMEELAPYIEKALARKPVMKPLDEAEIPEFPAYGRTIIDEESRL